MLVKYEFLKILRKKSTLIIMAVSLILTAFLFGLPIIQFQTYNQEGVMKGFEGIEYQKTQYEDISVSLTNEYIAGAIREVQELFENSDNVGYDGYEQFLIDGINCECRYFIKITYTTRILEKGRNIRIQCSLGKN